MCIILIIFVSRSIFQSSRVRINNELLFSLETTWVAVVEQTKKNWTRIFFAGWRISSCVARVTLIYRNWRQRCRRVTKTSAGWWTWTWLVTPAVTPQPFPCFQKKNVNHSVLVKQTTQWVETKTEPILLATFFNKVLSDIFQHEWITIFGIFSY